MLYVERGRLMIDGEPCRQVGFNAYYEFLRTLLNNSDTNYIASLDKLQEYGVRVIRCMITPFWPGGAGGWSVYDTAGGLNATFYNLLDDFMDACAARDIQIVIPLFWRHASLPDLFTETVNQMGTAGSASLTYAVSVATEMATRYKDHAACGMWQVGNEWTNYGKSGALPTTSVSNGTPASYSAPNDVLTKAQCQYAVQEITNAIRAVDPDRAIIGAAGKLIITVPSSDPLTLLGYATAHAAYDTGAVDCYGLHIYTGSEFGAAPMYALSEYSSIVRQAARNKPVILDEIGVSEEDATLNATWGAINGLLADPAAPDLTLLWNWGDLNTYGSGDTRWDVFPGVNREYQADAVRAAQASRISANLAQGAIFSPSSWCRFRGGTSTPDCVYFDSGVVEHTDSWTLSFWLRYLGRNTTAGNFWRAIGFGNESTNGFAILRNSAGGRVYAQVQLNSGAVNTNGKQPLNIPGQWLHHSVSWDSATGTLSHFSNGRYTSSTATHASPFGKGSNVRFVIGADKDLAYGLFCDLFDVRLYDSALSLPDRWEVYRNADASVAPTMRALFNGIDSGLTVQGSPEWMSYPAREIAADRTVRLVGA